MSEVDRQPEHRIVARISEYRTLLLQKVSDMDFNNFTMEDKDALVAEIKEYIYRSNNICSHIKTNIVYRYASDKSKRYYRQCADCFNVVENVPKASLSASEREEASERIEIDWPYVAQLRQEICDQLLKEIDNLANGAWWEWYNQYLMSPQWQEKRLLVLERAKGRCEGCGKAKATQVHHLTYVRVGREMLFDLAAVCDSCHNELHEDKK